MEKYIIENGIKYELRGDVYYPMLKLDEQTNYQIGKYGCLHLDYIKQHRKVRYNTLLVEARLNSYLHEIEVQVHPLYGFCLDLFTKIWYNYRANYAIRR